MKALASIPLVAVSALAHVMSMSSGDIRVEGARAYYELRMPLYEIAHVQDPAHSLFEHIRFSSRGEAARAVETSCHADYSQGQYVCRATYEFPRPADRLEVECTFHSVTVPNHVHLLKAQWGEKRDQAILDFSFPKAEMRFEPPGALEIAATQIGAGLWRVLGGVAQWLFLAALVLAARSRRELLALAWAFLAGQTASALLVRLTPWQPAPRFVEAAAALTIAYLAVEILLLPQAGSRWAVAGVLGTFHGLYFDLFLRSTGYLPGLVLGGAVLGDVLLLGAFTLVFTRLGRLAAALRPVQVSSCLLLATGLAWFFLRLGS